jgi:uncharacterized protein YegL
MSLGGKIEALNQAIRQSIDPMRDAARSHPFAHVYIRCLKFSNGASWHIKTPTPLSQFEWDDLNADPIQFKPVETEIIFLLDTSGSMGKEKDFIVQKCTEFADIIVQKGANVRLGVVGFAFGDIVREPQHARVVRLSKYNLGIWDLCAPKEFKQNISELKLRQLGPYGCYLAKNDTVEIFDHIAALYSRKKDTKKILVIISDEMGGTEGVEAITQKLNENRILTYVVGLAGELGAHQSIARKTNGHFWNIRDLRATSTFENLLNEVAESIAEEVAKERADGVMGTGTDMGQALHEVSQALGIPFMEENALPPVLVLISDGKPTDDFDQGYYELIDSGNPWGVKAVKISIAIGSDASHAILKKFMAPLDFDPLIANDPDALVRQVKWVTTTVLKSVSSPASQAGKENLPGNVPIPRPPKEKVSVKSVW